MNRPNEIELELAHLAHELWCKQMRREGWQFGRTIDAAAKTHDALVGFDALSPVDLRQLIAGLRTFELVERVLQSVDYPREPKELGVSDVTVGARVELVDDPNEQGTIIAWTEDAEWPGCLEDIQVRWDDGHDDRMIAAERTLRLVEAGA